VIWLRRYRYTAAIIGSLKWRGEPEVSGVGTSIAGRGRAYASTPGTPDAFEAGTACGARKPRSGKIQRS